MLGYHLRWLRLVHSPRTLLLSRVNHHSSLGHWGLLLGLEVLLHLGSLLLHQLHHLLSLGRHPLWIHHLSHVDRSIGNLLSHRNDWELLLLLLHRRHGLLLHIGLLVHHRKLLLLLLLRVLAHPWLCSENRLLLALTCQNCRGCLLSLGLQQLLRRTRHGHAWCSHGAAVGDSLLLLRGGRFLLDPPIGFRLDQLATSRPLPP